jgi:predicted ABC-type exoprotein transport system permease subunit
MNAQYIAALLLLLVPSCVNLMPRVNTYLIAEDAYYIRQAENVLIPLINNKCSYSFVEQQILLEAKLPSQAKPSQNKPKC